MSRTGIYPAIFLLFYVFIVKIASQKFNKIQLFLLSVSFLLFFYGSLVSFVTAESDSVAQTFFIFICVLIALSLFILSKDVFGQRFPFVSFKCLFIISLVWSLVIWISFLSPEFRHLMSQIFYRDYSRGAHLVELRVPAFHSVGGDGSSLNLSLLVLASFGYLAYLEGFKKLIGWALLLIALISTLLLGRSGFILGFPLFTVLSVFVPKTSPKNKVLILSFYFIIVTLIASALINWPAAMYRDTISSLGYEHPYSRTLRLIVEIQEGRVSHGVIGTLFNMFAVPNNNWHLIFGTGSFGAQLASIDSLTGTDVGYMKVLNGIGVVGSFVMYFLFLFGATFCFFKRKGNAFWSVYVSVLTIFVMAGHIKVEYVNTVMASIVLFFLVFVVSSRQSLPYLNSHYYIHLKNRIY